jgi:hypothetical protein
MQPTVLVRLNSREYRSLEATLLLDVLLEPEEASK